MLVAPLLLPPLVAALLLVVSGVAKVRHPEETRSAFGELRLPRAVTRSPAPVLLPWAEIVLAVANLMWFVFAGVGALTVEGGADGGIVPRAVAWIARLTPSGALTEALTRAMTLSVDWFGLAVLAIWGAAAGLCALRWFRFT